MLILIRFSNLSKFKKSQDIKPKQWDCSLFFLQLWLYIYLVLINVWQVFWFIWKHFKVTSQMELLYTGLDFVQKVLLKKYRQALSYFSPFSFIMFLHWNEGWSRFYSSYLRGVGKVNKQLHGSLIDVPDHHFSLSALCQLSSKHRPKNISQTQTQAQAFKFHLKEGQRDSTVFFPTWSKGCRQTGSHDEHKSSWRPPPAPRHRVLGVSSAGWSLPESAAGVCLRRTACVLAGGPLQGACWGPPEYSDWWCPFQWCLDVR